MPNIVDFKYAQFADHHMFCPECGTLAFPNSEGVIEKCPNYGCDFTGHQSGKDGEVCENPKCDEKFSGDECPECGTKRGIDIEIDGTVVQIQSFKTSTAATSRDRRTRDDADQQRGVLTTKTYICPKCDSDQIFSELQQTRSSDEPETRILTCSKCTHGWREY